MACSFKAYQNMGIFLIVRYWMVQLKVLIVYNEVKQFKDMFIFGARMVTL